MKIFIKWLEAHQQPCFYKNIFGIDCPGCGAQRSFILLLKGNFAGSFIMYPSLLLFMALFFLLLLHLLFKFKYGGVVIKYFFLFTAFAVMLNFILKLIHHT